ncbi:hypothetical protein LOK49_LG04G01452 [Camellia lanceoleosa]|uniref:Uncharacterized protein n=1 Tax=Camellia lanceoleosa TaxID=1840588 RepID=A0ACC0HVY4_9ERIC|nr:hypothetical protein LOK49_LG04G01452 [Camellia lanceoleosa]
MAFKFKMSVSILCVVSPNSEVSNCFGFFASVREANRHLDWSKFIARDRSLVCHGRLMNGKKQKWNYCSSNADFSYSCLVESGLERKGKFHVLSSMVANPTGEMTVSSEQMVYEVVLKQAALVKKRHKTKENYDVKPDVVLPGNLSLLSEAYDRCGEICAEYAKTFYLGTLLMTPKRRRAIMGNICLSSFLFLMIVLVHTVWCRRTDELVDGPNASHITPTALDRWESRLEDLFRGRLFDMLDAALSDTVAKFTVDIQPFEDMIEGMRMDLRKSRYKNFDELYLYCYYVAGTVGLMCVPIMGIAPESARRGRVYLPQDELAEAGLSDEDIFVGKVIDKWRNFMKNQIKRAKMFCDEAEKGVTELSSSSRWPVWASLLLYS